MSASAGFEVRNHPLDMSALFTIQVLAPEGYVNVDLDAAQTALTAAYGSAFAELSERVEAARNAQ